MTMLREVIEHPYKLPYCDLELFAEKLIRNLDNMHPDIFRGVATCEIIDAIAHSCVEKHT